MNHDEIAAAIHYPECWDTAAYPTVESALSEVYAAFKCTNHIGASGPRYDWTVSGMKQSETGNWVMAGESSGTDSAMAKDAERYRWLRDKSEPGICAFYLSVGEAFKGVRFKRETVDEAIDAQIAASAEKGGA